MTEADKKYLEEAQKSFEAISHMLERSREQGLEVEVVYSFSEAISAKYSIPHAAFHALSEWDC